MKVLLIPKDPVLLPFSNFGLVIVDEEHERVYGIYFPIWSELNSKQPRTYWKYYYWYHW